MRLWSTQFKKIDSVEHRSGRWIQDYRLLRNAGFDNLETIKVLLELPGTHRTYQVSK